MNLHFDLAPHCKWEAAIFSHRTRAGDRRKIGWKIVNQIGGQRFSRSEERVNRSNLFKDKSEQIFMIGLTRTEISISKSVRVVCLVFWLGV